MHKVYLQLGTNLGDKKKHLKDAILHIKDEIGDVVLKSKIYETTAWGVKNQANYLNQVLLVECKLSANFLLKKILEIEKNMGRIRCKKWQKELLILIFYFITTLLLKLLIFASRISIFINVFLF